MDKNIADLARRYEPRAAGQQVPGAEGGGLDAQRTQCEEGLFSVVAAEDQAKEYEGRREDV